MTFEEYWFIVAEKTGETVTKEQLKYYCEIAYGQGQASSVGERRHGRWINRGRAVSGLYHNFCPICKQDVISDSTNYCGNCGADMRKGGTE